MVADTLEVVEVSDIDPRITFLEQPIWIWSSFVIASFGLPSLALRLVDLPEGGPWQHRPHYNQNGCEQVNKTIANSP